MRCIARRSLLVAPLLAIPVLAALVLAILLLAPALDAQQVREVQVALDPERGVTEVGPDLRRELGLFPGVDGFQSARLFRQDDGTLILEISRVEAGTLVRERQRLGDEQIAAFRADLATRFAAQGRTRAVDRAGRSGLVLAETILGVGLYGWAVPMGFDVDSDRGAVASYLLTAGLSFYLPYRITRDASVSIAERNAAIWGGTRGIIHGLMLAEVINGPLEPFTPQDPFDPDEPYEDPSDRHDRVRALSVLGMSVLETVLAYQTVNAWGTDEGAVGFWGAAGDFGIPFGYGLAYLAGLFDEDRMVCEFDVCYSEDRWSRGAHASALAVALASPILAHYSGEGVRYTIGDARALRSFGLLGAQAALVPAWAAFQAEEEDDEPDKPTIAALLAGSAAGLWLGNRVLAERSLSGGEGALVLAGHVAGGLGALGVTYLLAGEDADPLVYITTSAVGSIAGSLLTLRAVSSGPDPVAGSDDGAGARFEITPLGALVPRAPLLRFRF
jgi:hypothetical protein